MAGVISSLVNTRDLELECARVLYEILLVSVLMCGIGTMLHKEKERTRIRALHMNNLRALGY